MKKFLILILSLVCMITSCASEQMNDSASESTSETTTTSDTISCEATMTTETTTDVLCSGTSETATEYTDTSETTTSVNHPYGGTGGLPSNETTATLETTATDSVDRYNLGLEYIMEYAATIITDGEAYEPYTSTIYYQNPYMVGDGILMFVSMENQLPHWIEDDVIPYIEINADSDVSFEYDIENAELKCSGKFRIYVQDENGIVSKIKEFSDSNLAEVFAYGKEELAGQTVYISYPFLLQTGDFAYLSDSMFADRAVHDIMCLFKTTF